MKDFGVKEVKFEIPEAGSFKVSINEWKHVKPFPHYNKEQIEEFRKERAKEKEHIVWRNGCGIGYVDKIEDGYDIIKNYAEQHLKLKKAELEIDLEKVNKAIEITKEFDWIQLFREE